jgi:hypothetical protein
MNCKIFRIELDKLEWQREALALPEDLQTHFDSCAACREHMQLQRQMLAVLENDAAPVVPADLTTNILNRLDADFAFSRPQAFLSWKRLMAYVGYALALALALWLAYKNADFSGINQLWRSPVAQQIQQWLAASGAAEILPAVQNFLARILSLVPLASSLFEKAFGKEVLPRAFNLGMILLLTFAVAKASIVFDSWLRQISRRSS